MPRPSRQPQAPATRRPRAAAPDAAAPRKRLRGNAAAAAEERSAKAARNRRGGGRTRKLRSQSLAENRYRPQPFSLWAAFRPVVALALLPVCWIVTAAFFRCFGAYGFQQEFWATDVFRMFAIGALLWLVMFFGLPRPVTLYVFGHELTHALWVLAMGGRVTEFHVSDEGGHIMTTKTNFWIALAPYFFPVYSIGLIVSFGAMQFFWDISGLALLLYMLLGMTWCFHMTFTAWMITKEQSDLTQNGVFFSLVVIYLMNLVVLATLLISLSKEATWYGFWLELEYGLRGIYRLVVL